MTGYAEGVLVTWPYGKEGVGIVMELRYQMCALSETGQRIC